MLDDICAGIPNTDGTGGADGGKGKLKMYNNIYQIFLNWQYTLYIIQTKNLT